MKSIIRWRFDILEVDRCTTTCEAHITDLTFLTTHIDGWRHVGDVRRIVKSINTIATSNSSPAVDAGICFNACFGYMV